MRMNSERYFSIVEERLNTLTNINSQTPNAPGVDLADYEKKGDLASILNCYV